MPKKTYETVQDSTIHRIAGDWCIYFTIARGLVVSGWLAWSQSSSRILRAEPPLESQTNQTHGTHHLNRSRTVERPSTLWFQPPSCTVDQRTGHFPDSSEFNLPIVCVVTAFRPRSSYLSSLLSTAVKLPLNWRCHLHEVTGTRALSCGVCAQMR